MLNFFCKAAARLRDAATSFNTLPQPAALRAGRAGSGEWVLRTGRNCRPCPKATSSHPFGLAKILFVCSASQLVLVSRKNACSNAAGGVRQGGQAERGRCRRGSGSECGFLFLVECHKKL